MSRVFERKIARWLLLGLAFLPAAVLACQSLFNRLLRDDYIYHRIARELGLWQSIAHWRETWVTSFSDLVVHGLLAPLDRAAPAIAALLMIALSIIGFSWLLQQVTTWLGFGWAGWLPCAALAALMAAAGIAAFYSPQSLRWYSPVVEYGLPMALMPLYFALLLEMGKRRPSRIWLCFSCLVSCVIGFLIAGFAEIHIIFQLGFMTPLLIAGIALTRRETRQRAALLLGAGWLGTMASLAVQLTSSGGLRRAAIFLEFPQFQPVRDPLQLARFALADSYQLLMQAETLSGLALLFALGLLVSLGIKTEKLPPGYAWRLGADRLPLPYIALLLVQLLFLPLLWTHSSDNPQFLGRFSASYLVAVLGNLAMTLFAAALVLRYRRLRLLLQGGGARPAWFALAFTAAAMLLLCLPRLRPIDESAALLLYATALCLFAIAWWEWTAALNEPGQQWLSLLAMAVTLVALLASAAVATGPRFFVGVGGPRHWVGPAFALTSQGLVWGLVIGQGCWRLGASTRARLRLASGALLAILYVALLIGQIRQIPDLALYASEWDDRHSLLISLRAEGQLDVVIPPRAFDLVAFVMFGEKRPDSLESFSEYSKIQRYYGLRSITLAESG